MVKEISEEIGRLRETIHRLNIRQNDSNPEVTNQYGYIKFGVNDVNATTRLSQYIRLALQTDAKTVVEFMKYGWDLPTPDLVISVTGGGKQCHMPAHLRKTFQRGLVAAAATTNAWLITAGTNAGVVKEVGQALNNYRYKNRKQGLDVPCIGIGTWKYTAGNEQLESSTVEPSVTASQIDISRRAAANAGRRLRLGSFQLDVSDQHHIHSYMVKQPETKRCDLEPNHTHFLLFEGRSSSTDTALLQRARIEQCAREINIYMTKADAPIPIVMILVEGGPYSVRTICQALKSNTPLVVVKGSGRAADLVADLHSVFSQTATNESETEQRSGAKSARHARQTEVNSILERARDNNNSWIDEVKDDLCQVLSDQNQLVVVFEFDSPRHHGNLEDAILEALFNATKFSGDHLDEQLKLAMAWKNSDYAKKHILTDTTISKWTESDLYEALVEALRRGYVDFVELLMDYGTSFEKLTLSNLELLYASADIDMMLPIDEDTKGDMPGRDDYYTCYFSDRPDFKQTPLDKNAPLGQSASRELFLWAIFLDRFELAKYLCSKTWNQTTSPLLAARIYRHARFIALHSAKKQRYRTHASEFDKYATAIIDQCFHNDENFAVYLLEHPAAAFGDLMPLQLADEAECQTFLASDCVQRYLDQKWYGHINYKRRAINFRIFLYSLFLPLLPFFSVFLPYVRKNTQIAQNNQNHSKPQTFGLLQTVTRSDREMTNEPIRWSEKVVYFYRAPIVQFCYNVIFFILYLGLFSFVLLVDYFPLNIHHKRYTGMSHLPIPVTEIVLHVCTWSLIIEEGHQFNQSNFFEYFFNIWNLIDVAAIGFYLIAFLTRFIVQEVFFMISKIFLCLDLILWFVRTLHLFSAFERLGPKLLMIFNTMRDLSFFLCFILIFLCGFSITSWSLITSADQINWIYGDDGKLLNITVTVDKQNSWTWQLVRDIAQYGVWKVFGQVDPIGGTDTYSNMAFILAIVFVAIANILLLNVLIALFNVTIQNVQEQSHDLWRYQRFLVVNEFSKKPPLPPPFNMIYYVFAVARFLVGRVRRRRSRHRSVTSELLLDDIKTIDNTVQQQFTISDEMRKENAIAEDYWHEVFKQNRKDAVEDVLQNIEEKIDHFIPYLHGKKRRSFIDRPTSKQRNVESDV